MRSRNAVTVGAGLVTILFATACGGPAQVTHAAECIRIVDAEGEETGECLPVASRDQRVDLADPTFTDPTTVTNPLHPTSEIAQTVYGGQVDGAPFRTEVTLLPGTKTITWNGRQINAVISQYLAFSGGRIKEVALDWYAQADDGSVWYLGEDVVNYEDGGVADTEGTWLAGRDAPVAMIMPAGPRPGDVYRPENAPELVFEEVTVKAVDQPIVGPGGPVTGAVVVSELHRDGTYEDKTFAPGYGEFSTGQPSGDLEAVSLALPTDATTGPMPAELTTLATAVRAAFDTVGRGDWAAASAAVTPLTTAWGAYRPADVPLEMLRTQMSRDIDSLAAAVQARDGEQARGAVLRVAQNDLDLSSRYRPVVDTDRARLDLWVRQLLVDAAANDPNAVSGDVATLQRTFDRVRHTTSAAAAVDARLADLRGAVDGQDLAAAARLAGELPGLLTP